MAGLSFQSAPGALRRYHQSHHHLSRNPHSRRHYHRPHQFKKLAPMVSDFFCFVFQKKNVTKI